MMMIIDIDDQACREMRLLKITVIFIIIPCPYTYMINICDMKHNDDKEK